jgi:hypothetical protein
MLRRDFIAGSAAVGLLLLPGTNSSRAQDPYSTAWFALQIAAGMVAWVGGKVMSSLFDDDDDMQKLVALFVAQVRPIIKEEINTAFLQQALDEARALQIELQQYQVAPSSDRLESITARSLYLSSRLQSFALAGHHPYLLVNSIHLYALQERSLARPAELQNIVTSVERGHKHATEMEEQWKVAAKQAVLVTPLMVKLRNPLGGHVVMKVGYESTVRGIVYETAKLGVEADVRSRAEAHSLALNEAEFIRSSLQTTALWQELSASISDGSYVQHIAAGKQG